MSIPKIAKIDGRTPVRVRLDFVILHDGEGIPYIKDGDVLKLICEGLNGSLPSPTPVLPGSRLDMRAMRQQDVDQWMGEPNPRAHMPPGNRRAQLARRKSATRRR